VTFPTESAADAYFGDHGFSIAPTLALSKRLGAWSAGGNLGYLARQHATLLDLVVDDEVFVRAGVSYDLGDRIPVTLAATLSAATAVAGVVEHVNADHLEALFGATYQIDPQLQLFGAAGAGLAHGFGTPDARAMLGIRLTRGGGHAPPPRIELDRDGDGIADSVDQCPTQPEDVDGFEDDDGCPDPDNDNDGVLDQDDKCPQVWGPIALDGCPDGDADHDGVPDRFDRCPSEPEDRDGFQDDDGCPDPDNDRDGIPDADDRCPTVPGIAALHGCPDPDTDGDGVVDRLDNCPAERGPASNAGCAKPQWVRLGDGKLDLIESVYFKLDSAIIEKRSYALLDNVAAVITSHPALVIQVEGHTDNQGNAAYNIELSQRRAQAVVDHVVAKGAPRAQVRARSFGQTQPIADNRTKEGRAQNRRVVFTIVGATDIENRRQGADDSTKEP
jgi:outer membrane protein OmpA-like peptidoglycan-associated protein